MKITLEMMEMANIPYSWNTIYTALLYDFIEITEVEKYAIILINQNEYVENSFYYDLLWGGKSKTDVIQMLLEEKLVELSNIMIEKELEKIKYVMLYCLNKNFHNSVEILLTKIAEIYADFNYPEDMSHFVYYMPINNPFPMDHKDAKQTLIYNFENYLLELKQKL